MTKLTVIIATAVALLATVLSPAHAQEQHALQLQTAIVNDDPDLVDRTPPYSWWKQIPEIDRLGYGSNGFNYTFAIGNDPDDMFDNWAKWEFDSVDDRYEVQGLDPRAMGHSSRAIPHLERREQRLRIYSRRLRRRALARSTDQQRRMAIPRNAHSSRSRPH